MSQLLSMSVSPTLKEVVYYMARGYCEVCGILTQLDKFQAAHRLHNTPKSDKGNVAFIKKYWWNEFRLCRNTKDAREILNHPFNLACTCSEKCNSKVLIDNNPVERRKLLYRIHLDMDKKE